MNTGVISMRYARALYAYAAELGDEDAIYANMLQLMHTLQTVKELPVVLRSPSLTKEEKIELLCSAVDESPIYRRFAALVVDEEREDMLLFIAHCYISLYRKAKNIISVTLTIAAPMTDGFKEKAASVIAAGKGMDVELSTVVDPSIIGGFIYEAASERFDASIERQMRDIRNKLVEQNRKLV